MARSSDHDDQQHQQQQHEQEHKRLQELRQKPEAQRSAEEKAELERLEKSQQERAQQRPQNQGTSGTERPPGSRPLDHPTPGALSAEEQGRLRELNAKRTILTDEETAERDELLARNTPQSAALTDRVQRELSPDRPVSPITDFPRDQANRLRDLRVAADMGRLSDEERSEMGKLGMEESKAAGHAEPMEAKEAGDESGVIYQLLALIEGIIAKSPTFRDLEIRARVLHDRLDELRDSPEGPELDHRQGGRREGVTTSRPAH
jgi:hypothetical protein